MSLTTNLQCCLQGFLKIQVLKACALQYILAYTHIIGYVSYSWISLLGQQNKACMQYRSMYSTNTQIYHQS